MTVALCPLPVGHVSEIWLFWPVPKSPGRPSQEQPGPHKILILKHLYGSRPQMCHWTQKGCGGKRHWSCTRRTEDPCNVYGQNCHRGPHWAPCWASKQQCFFSGIFSTLLLVRFSFSSRQRSDFPKDRRLRRGGLILCLFQWATNCVCCRHRQCVLDAWQGGPALQTGSKFTLETADRLVKFHSKWG